MKHMPTDVSSLEALATSKIRVFNQFWHMFALLCFMCCIGCQKPVVEPPAPFTPIAIESPLARVNIIEHSNLSETITNSDRLKELAQRNFLAPQPYRKVMRVFARDHQGSTRSIITSYYENGQIQQYLECLNGRACGLYLEWYSNGVKKVQAMISAGQADLDENSLLTWSFDGDCTTWDEQGSICAIFRYQRGALNGPSETFYDTGEKRSLTNYECGLKQGVETYFAKDGTILQTITFKEDSRHGPAKGYLSSDTLLWSEEYTDNLLMNAEYFSKDQAVISSVKDGEGVRTVFSEGALASQEDIKHGQLDGWTKVYDEDGLLERKYEVHNGQKDGLEIRYYPEKQLPRISIQWHDGFIHGTMKTWYENGELESQKEFSQNMKNGIAMSWYIDGGIMLVEEYVNDKLVRGQYTKKGESEPISFIEKGSGIATLFDRNGTQIEKIRYLEGGPQIDEG
jgi:antitoxin component YwqK of YwqJK toxin-antitoxin module